MVTTSSGRSNEAFLDQYALDAQTPKTAGVALDQTYAALENAEVFFGHGSDSAWDEAVFLLLSAMDLPLNSGDEVLSHAVNESQWGTVLDWLYERIVLRRPLPYLTGRAWFAGLAFKCDERALIPRSPLAEIIRNDYSPWWTDGEPRFLLDLCCGGGCIGIAAAVYQEELRVVIADIDVQALSLAQENIAMHSLEDRVTAAQSDLMEGLGDQRFDVILCNPPYVDASDLASMPAEFQAEPPIALGSGDDGLDMARRILQSAGDHLTSHGLLFLEVGNSWEALDKELTGVALTWIEFSEGGHGVLVVRAAELPAIVQSLES